MDYLAVKHSHMAIAMLSVILFYVRSFSRMGSGKLAKSGPILTKKNNFMRKENTKVCTI